MTLHARLVDRQVTDELSRKAHKSLRLKTKLWTVEELDYAERVAEEMREWLERIVAGER